MAGTFRTRESLSYAWALDRLSRDIFQNACPSVFWHDREETCLNNGAIKELSRLSFANQRSERGHCCRDILNYYFPFVCMCTGKGKTRPFLKTNSARTCGSLSYAWALDRQYQCNLKHWTDCIRARLKHWSKLWQQWRELLKEYAPVSWSLQRYILKSKCNSILNFYERERGREDIVETRPVPGERAQ